jgi:metal-sulfur cluster biosynthetic enzyme
MENPNPEIEVNASQTSDLLDAITIEHLKRMETELEDKVTADEIFSLVRDIKDPEHPELSLAQLRVVRREDIIVHDGGEGNIVLEYTPTIPTCSVAVLIGLTLLRKLQLCVSRTKHKIHVRIAEGKHVQEKQVNKQLADKERVAAAMENPNLSKLVREGVYKTDSIPDHLLLW